MPTLNTREFATKEEAWNAIHTIADDPCCDNHRFAWHDDAPAIKKYEKQQSEGCCGFVDLKITIKGRKAYIGLNYGH